jgi:RNA polymerase sigma factor (sigma-70 family)
MGWATSPWVMVEVTRELVALALDGERGALAELAERLLIATERRLPGLLQRHRARAGTASAPEREQLQYDLVEDLLYRYPRALRRWDPTAGLGFESYVGLLADSWLRRRLSTVRGSPWALRILGGGRSGDAMEAAIADAPALGHLPLEDEVALRLALVRAVETLEHGDRTLLLAYYLEGRTTEELAGELGVASNSVHQRLRRLRIRLAAALGPGAMPFEPEAPAPRGRSLRHG